MKPFNTILIIIFLFISSFLAAKTPAVFKTSRPDWVTSSKNYAYKAPLREMENGYFLSLEEEQIHVEKQSTYVRKIRNIVTESGIENGSEISVSFDPSFEKLDFHDITVWRNNKPINRLDLEKIKVIADEKEPNRFMYHSTYSALLILDDIRKGDRIEYAYTITGSNPIFNGKFDTFLYLQAGTPVSHIYTSLITSPARKLRLKYINNASKAKVTGNGGLVKYEWESFDQNAVEYEDNTPDWFVNCPMVQISEYQTWSEVAGWAYNINQQKTNFEGELGKFVASIRDKYKADKESAFRAAVQFVQDEVRYVDVAMGRYSHRAHKPEKVFLQRYGDCKDKALLLVSILRSLGIEAHPALVNTDDQERVTSYLPSPQVLNHMVVCARINRKAIWVDPTWQLQGGKGAKIYFPDYKKGLLISNETRNFIDIPRSKMGKYIAYERFSIVDYSHPADLMVKTVYTENEADYLRDRLASKGIAENEKLFLEYYSQVYPTIKSTGSLKVTDNRAKNEITTIEKYSIPEIFKQDSVKGTYHSFFYAGFISEILPKLKAQRTQPLNINPCSVEQTITVIMPGNWNIDDDTRDLNTKDYRFHSLYSSIEDTLSLHYEFEYLNNFIAPENSARFAKDIEQLKDDFLYFPVEHLPDNIAFYPNFTMIGFSIFGILAFAVVAYFLYKRDDSDSIYHRVPLPIGGFIVAVIISLIYSIYHRASDLIDQRYLDLNTWDFHNSRQTSVFYKVLLAGGLATDLYIICFSLFCLILIAKRRDILPATITVFFASSSILMVIIYILTSHFYGERNTPMDDVVYAVIVSFAGIYYFRESERVKETFVVRAKDQD